MEKGINVLYCQKSTAITFDCRYGKNAIKQHSSRSETVLALAKGIKKCALLSLPKDKD